MLIEIVNDTCKLTFKPDNWRDDQIELDRFSLKLLEEKIQILILEFHYGRKNFNLSLLFSSILHNPHIKVLSIRGFFVLNYSELKSLKDKSIDLELKYGININYTKIIQLVKAFKSVTHIEFIDVNSRSTEEDVIDFLQHLHCHNKLQSLVLPLPTVYSEKSIIALSEFVQTKNIAKFGFSSSCKAADILTIFSAKTKISNLGITNIIDLSEETCQAIFKKLIPNSLLTHFTLHNWKPKLSENIVKELSQLPHLESITLDCGGDYKFIIKHLPKLIRKNLNLRIIQMLHCESSFSRELECEYVMYRELYEASATNPSITHFKILEHEDCRHVFFPNGGDGGIALLNNEAAISYCSDETLKRNKIINDLSHPMQFAKLNEYLESYEKYFVSATVQPVQWRMLRIPPLYYLCLQKGFTFFKKNPNQIEVIKQLPDEIKRDLFAANRM